MILTSVDTLSKSGLKSTRVALYIRVVMSTDFTIIMEQYKSINYIMSYMYMFYPHLDQSPLCQSNMQRDY